MQAVNPQSAGEHYRSLELQSVIEQADPHSLVAMLYEELMLCIDVLTIRARKKTRLTDDEQAHRARAIITSLRSGLNFDSNAAFVEMLDDLYAALSAELEQRLADPDPLRFSELKASVESVALAWAAVADG
jgi:flagellar secretion chaperone FliS